MHRLRFVRWSAPILVGVVGLVILVVLSEKLVERGETADATGTSGYTTNAEIALGLFGLGCVLLAGGLIARRYGQPVFGGGRQSFFVGVTVGLFSAFVATLTGAVGLLILGCLILGVLLVGKAIRRSPDRSHERHQT